MRSFDFYKDKVASIVGFVNGLLYLKESFLNNAESVWYAPSEIFLFGNAKVALFICFNFPRPFWYWRNYQLMNSDRSKFNKEKPKSFLLSPRFSPRFLSRQQTSIYAAQKTKTFYVKLSLIIEKWLFKVLLY